MINNLDREKELMALKVVMAWIHMSADEVNPWELEGMMIQQFQLTSTDKLIRTLSRLGGNAVWKPPTKLRYKLNEARRYIMIDGSLMPCWNAFNHLADTLCLPRPPSPAAVVTHRKRRHSGHLLRSGLKAISEAESVSDCDQPGPSNKMAPHHDDNEDDGAPTNSTRSSTPRGHESASSGENEDKHMKKNEGCPKCHKTMYGKACLKCQDGCSKWWHTRCFDATLHYRADEAKARARDGQLLCAACRKEI
ncbi:unnamed protein product, partial [Mesorhabditis belari]|uniref:Zinc finger PHD-type domain-containing protein n=1 Tax=Mesorhabditis belari TaxID=2138241 RepID=A0AAF3EEQ7_9BILA